MIVCILIFLAAAIVLAAGRNLLPQLGKQIILVLMLSAGIGMLAGYMEQQNTGLTAENTLKRNLYGEGTYEKELWLEAGEVLENYSYTVKVPEQLLTKDEENSLLEAAKEEIEKDFPGENESVNLIRLDVNIRDSYQNGYVTADWSFDNYEVINVDGEISMEQVPEEGVLINASVDLACGTSASCYEFGFRVMPVILDKQEIILRELDRYIEEQEQRSQFLKLPEKLAGQKLVWSEVKEHSSEKILILGMLFAALLPMLQKSKEQEKRKRREEALVQEYPEVISKLVLLMGAGMTLSGAWKKIATQYENKRKEDTFYAKPAYDEMLITCYEMENGISEEQAYERFGNRCGIRRYRKLGNTLSQNLRKGTSGLKALLEGEAEEAFEERKSLAKKKGEEAGTKLLFPMMLMLGMIMVLLVVPAMLSFQI